MEELRKITKTSVKITGGIPTEYLPGTSIDKKGNDISVPGRGGP
jgi:hypothetical protein